MSRLLLLEGETPLATSRYQIGFLAACAIVALRLGIGLHFFSEGVAKLGTSFSAGFMGSAKGPFAPTFKNMVWDREGYYRLNYKETVAYWDQYRNRIVSHYGFDDKQQAAAKQTLEDHADRLDDYLGAKKEDIDQYVQAVKRRDANAADPSRAALASLRARCPDRSRAFAAHPADPDDDRQPVEESRKRPERHRHHRSMEASRPARHRQAGPAVDGL